MVSEQVVVSSKLVSIIPSHWKGWKFHMLDLIC